MFIKEYRYSLKPDVLKEFTKIQRRVNQIYKTNGLLYQVIIVDYENHKDVMELNMFRDEEHYFAFNKATEGNLDLFRLFEQFKQLIATKTEDIREKSFFSIFDNEDYQ